MRLLLLTLVTISLISAPPVATWPDACHVRITWRPPTGGAVLVTKKAPDGTWAWYGETIPLNDTITIPHPGDTRPSAIPREGDTVYLRIGHAGGSAVTLLAPPSECRYLWFPLAAR